MRRAGFCVVQTTLVTLLLLAFALSVVEVSALEGVVRFRGSVYLPEFWSSACYGSYEILATVQEIISDPAGLLTVNASISVCYSAPLGLTIGEYVDCYGYYYYSSGPMGCLSHCWCGAAEDDDYQVIRASLLGDVDQDFDVDIFDVVQCAAAYGSTPSSPNWNIYCDFADPYWTIDIFDLVVLASNYGEE